jgi:redox-sensitive bicupin YhaK (pirin superfamily)
LQAIDELWLTPGTTFVERQAGAHETCLFVSAGTVEVASGEAPAARASALAHITWAGTDGEALWVWSVEANVEARLTRVVCARPGANTQAPTVSALARGDGTRPAVEALPLEGRVSLRWECLRPGRHLRLAPRPGRLAWLQVLSGTVSAEPVELSAGDGAALEGGATVSLEAREAAEVLVVDVEDTGDRLLWNGD